MSGKKQLLYALAVALFACAVFHVIDGNWLSVLSSSLFTLSMVMQGRSTK